MCSVSRPPFAIDAGGSLSDDVDMLSCVQLSMAVARGPIPSIEHRWRGGVVCCRGQAELAASDPCERTLTMDGAILFGAPEGCPTSTARADGKIAIAIVAAASASDFIPVTNILPTRKF
jgi:hypothetical protein